MPKGICQQNTELLIPVPPRHCLCCGYPTESALVTSNQGLHILLQQLLEDEASKKAFSSWVFGTAHQWEKLRGDLSHSRSLWSDHFH